MTSSCRPTRPSPTPLSAQVGVGRHDVAIPVNQLKEDGGRFILAGATKDAIKAMPEFEYATR